jgi:uncharacterized protein
MKFDRHTLVLLVRPPNAPELTDEEAAELQDRHLAFRADLRDRGYLVGGGPLVDRDDDHLRGISIMSCDPETARRLSSEDPAVRAGRLAVEVMTWMVPAGNVRFEDVAAPRSTAEAED